jgi:multidrug resistance efflux pump
VGLLRILTASDRFDGPNTMTIKFREYGQYALTLAMVFVAAFVLWRLWAYYMLEPWTRDGRVRADVVQVAPDVSGLITEVRVHDNQVVHAGDVLFVIDRPRYALALAQAQATLDGTKVQLEQARREDRRNRLLGNLVPIEVREQSGTRLDQLNAAIVQNNAALDTARLNLERTEIKASVNGLVTNFDLRPGNYATAGRPVFALVDQDSFHVVGYFEENKIPRVHVGDRARVRLMGDPKTLNGQVEGIAAGIEDRERSGSSNLLANVNPTFNWVRLPQRIPVRIKLDPVPEGVRLIMGRTATVEILPDPHTVAVGDR